MPTRVAQPVRPDLSQQHASRAGDRTFTGNANLRPATGMETLTSDTAQRLSTSAAFPKPVASTQPAFTIGSGAASVSPSKKRMHNALKTRQGSAAASTTLPPRANPFAQYGVANGVSSSQPGRTTARGSPLAAQSGFGSPHPSPRRSLKTVRRSDGAQGMNIDLTTPLEAAAADLIKSNASQPAASSAFNGSATQPVAQPESASSTAASSFFAQKRFPAPLSTQASFSTGTGSTSQTRNSEQAAPDTPSAHFPSSQPGIQNQKTPGPSAAKRGLRGKLKPGSHAHTPHGTPAGTPMSTGSQGTPLTPMDISPQQYTEGPASAPTPPPQPQFTPQAAAPSNPSFQFSFGASSSSDVPKQAGQHGRPVPGSPHARRTRPTPRKQPHPQISQPPKPQAQAQPVRGHMASGEERAKVEAAAERDRQQGNMAFAKPDYLAAGKLYTQGLNTLDRAGIHDGEVFVRLLTNRAACHLSLARPLSALKDCHMAVEADPTNVRAATRAATCHIKMGQLTEATAVLEAVKATVPAGHPVPSDLASKQSDLELTKRMVTEAKAALQAAGNMPAVKEAQKLVESLSWEGGYCPFSQSLQALNATALLRLHRFDEAVSLARKHAAPSRECPTGLHWPWWVQAQAAFLKGDLTQMQELLQGGVQKLEQHPDHQEDVPTRPELTGLLANAHKLLQLKEAGNKAVQAQNWQDAIKIYTLAITNCADAPPLFAAVLHSNRAAVHQHLDQYTDAVADSLRAKALDPSYAKVYSRLAAVLGSLHLSSGVVAALEQLAELMKSHGARDPFKTASRLSQARGDVRRKQPVHHYRLFGLSQTCASEEVRKAYKKCSLRFHPDKAVTHCKFAFSLGLQGAALADRLEIETRVRDEANWLFKCISEANVVLSDPQKRHILDSELEFEERRMFYRNDLSTPPGGSYSFSRPAASANNRASANPRPAANPQPSAHARAGMRHSSRTTNERAWWQNGGDSDDSDEELFGSHPDSGFNFY
ncbi:hypothetical protein WJX82_000922 [Trebouxia sp. C0006]